MVLVEEMPNGRFRIVDGEEEENLEDLAMQMDCLDLALEFAGIDPEKYQQQEEEAEERRRRRRARHEAREKARQEAEDRHQARRKARHQAQRDGTSPEMPPAERKGKDGQWLPPKRVRDETNPDQNDAKKIVLDIAL